MRALLVVKIVFSTLILSLLAMAQGPAYHPGQTIRISVTFEGPDATKITSVQMVSNIGRSGPSQPGFKTEIFPGESKQTGPKTFEVSYTIPDNQATADYPLQEIRAIVNQSAPIVLHYHSPDDYSARIFKVDNPKSINKPTIKELKELSTPQ